MGQEAECICKSGDIAFTVRALLESAELILRGGMPRRIPFGDMQRVRVEGENLSFSFGEDSISLTLGNNRAAKWAQAILSPPPTLAKKLGITPQTTAQVLGPIDDPVLRAALDEAKEISATRGDLILLRVDSPHGLAAALEQLSEQLAHGVPLWVIYPKGKGHQIDESTVRASVKAQGMTDTKVAAVSSSLTALRFNKRKNQLRHKHDTSTTAP